MNAELGDDVYGEDPTVNRLQDMLAEMTGFEAGLFMPTGSMSNQVALAAHTGRGEEVIAPEGAHIYEYEIGALSALSGLVPRLVPAPGGMPNADAIRAAVHHSIHQAPTGLIVLENTHNRAGGTVLPLECCHAIAQVATDEGLPLHLDGARAFNAAVALGVEIADVCRPFDSVSICLSKGLAAPVGSVLLGSREFIRTAHRYRKMFGGGMRQAGVLAAAGIVALSTMVDRLGEDHERAHRLAEGLAALAGIKLDLATVQTNIIYFSVQDAARLVTQLQDKAVLVNAMSPTSIRLVTHYMIDDADIRRSLEVMTKLMEQQFISS